MDKPSPNGASPVPLGPSGVEALREAVQWVIEDWERSQRRGARGNILEQEPEAIKRLRAGSIAEGNSPSLEVEALDALDAVFQELDSCSANDGERTGDEFRFGHRCVICDRNVDRNSVLRDRIRAVLRRSGR